MPLCLRRKFFFFVLFIIDNNNRSLKYGQVFPRRAGPRRSWKSAFLAEDWNPTPISKNSMMWCEKQYFIIKSYLPHQGANGQSFGHSDDPIPTREYRSIWFSNRQWMRVIGYPFIHTLEVEDPRKGPPCFSECDCKWSWSNRHRGSSGWGASTQRKRTPLSSQTTPPVEETQAKRQISIEKFEYVFELDDELKWIQI